MQIRKRDGSIEPVKLEKILNRVGKACQGLADVEPMDIAKRTIHGLHNLATTTQLDQLSIDTAVTQIALEPNYSKVAARLLAEFIREEIGNSDFRAYFRLGHELNLLALTATDEDLDALEAALRHDRDDLFEYFGLKTLSDRYLLRHPQTRKIIERPQWLFMRVALGVMGHVADALIVYDLISSFRFMPSTPTLFNAGTRFPQLSSCYLLTVQDDLKKIYKNYGDIAALSKYAGGIGVDYSAVRANGSLIRSTNGISNGIVPFLKVLDSSAICVNQGGKRKGAVAVYLQPWHADIEAFLDLRNSTGSPDRRTYHLNLALWIPDLFMRRVEADESWSLFSPDEVPALLETHGEAFDQAYAQAEQAGKAKQQIRARVLYTKMLTTLVETGNGWMGFKDTVNRTAPQTKTLGNIVRSSNLCTEITLVTSEQETAVCNLGSLNLGRYATTDAVDWDRLAQDTATAVRFLDRIIDLNLYPTEEARFSNLKWRPIGLGVMGLQDVFFKQRLPFDSTGAATLSTEIAQHIYYHAVTTSADLAQERSAFPAFADCRYADGTLHCDGFDDAQPLNRYDWATLRNRVRQGMRNSVVLAIAPTATIASIVGAYECIEPQLSNLFKRETLSGEFLQINHYLVAALKERGLWSEAMFRQLIVHEGSVQAISTIPEDLKTLFKTVWEIPQRRLIDMAAARARYIDQSQSLNLFVESPDMTRLASMYMHAWKRGIKTTYYLRTRAKTQIAQTCGTDICEVCQ